MMLTKLKDISHEKHTLDARSANLGRLATQVATLLVGKNKPYFARHLDCGDFVTVTNAKELKVTGKKETKKKYTHYSGYPGGLKTLTLSLLRRDRPSEIIRHAVSGMLPNNKLKKFWLDRLDIQD